MSVLLWRTDNGKPHLFQFSVDASEALAGGHYTDVCPKEVPYRTEAFTDDDMARIAGIAEKERVGSVVSEDELALLEDYRGLAGKLTPVETAPDVPSAPEPTEVADTFHPATANREELFSWLRKNDEQPPPGLSTANLRQRAIEKIGAVSGET